MRLICSYDTSFVNIHIRILTLIPMRSSLVVFLLTRYCVVTTSSDVALETFVRDGTAWPTSPGSSTTWFPGDSVTAVTAVAEDVTTTAAPPPAPPMSCTYEHGIDYAGNNIAPSAPSTSAEECGQLCTDLPACTHFTHIAAWGQCYRKNSNAGSQAAPADWSVVSGYCVPTTAAPSPTTSAPTPWAQPQCDACAGVNGESATAEFVELRLVYTGLHVSSHMQPTSVADVVGDVRGADDVTVQVRRPDTGALIKTVTSIGVGGEIVVGDAVDSQPIPGAIVLTVMSSGFIRSVPHPIHPHTYMLALHSVNSY